MLRNRMPKCGDEVEQYLVSEGIFKSNNAETDVLIYKVSESCQQGLDRNLS